jgi:cobyrinic acid a,c-diamide synthase
MIELPRLALATPPAASDPALATLALLAGLTERRWRVQHFRTRACPTATEAVGQVTGLPGRHLDAWLMPPAVCQALFVRAAQSTELAVVEGTLDEPVAERPGFCCDRPGALKPIAEILNLPVVVVVSCRHSEGELVHLPRLPDDVDAVLLDGLADASALPRLKRLYQFAAKVPVIAAIEDLPHARAALEMLPRNGRLPDDLIAELARAFRKHADLDAIYELARRRPLPEAERLSCLNQRARCRCGIRVAYANDEAFGRYFPDTIDALDALGVDLVEFSPLRDERLPQGADLVMVGCGFPDQHAEQLASNVSMIAALRKHVCRGRRIYSEGGGTVYLGQGMTIDGRRVPGVGIFPFEAELLNDPPAPTPVSRRLLHDSWIGPAGTLVRGYRSGRWRLISGADSLGCPGKHGLLSAEGDWFYHHHAVGSLLHLHLGALPEVVDAFIGPHSPSLHRPAAGPAADCALDRNEERDENTPL